MARHDSAAQAPGSPLDAAAELRGAGLSATATRRAVLDALVGREWPVSALELHADIRSRGMRVGLTTVYRTLHALAQTGLLHVFDRAGERTYRHCADGAHQHLVCRECGVVRECPAEVIADWLAHLRSTSDFVPDPVLINVPGLCGQCRQGAAAS
ncbi:Fur family transcriptional regulator [Actinomycetes bacterium KLBMP 9797]